MKSLKHGRLIEFAREQAEGNDKQSSGQCSKWLADASRR